ncbi:winged helix-turn-helix transcriptional regulator [Paenibacillus cymbidii]|uniref:winged helix-turn-helix transcriptional regulator n=1 Tax=Paenibacillus cymbidii TaxID=1639034 RepID=UPI002E277486
MATFCQFEKALEILVGKWKPLILLRLFANGTMRFSELQKTIPDINKKMLAQQLKELEHNDIVHREVYNQVPPKVEYSITEYGKGISPVLQVRKRLGGGAYVAHEPPVGGRAPGPRRRITGKPPVISRQNCRFAKITGKRPVNFRHLSEKRGLAAK